MVTILFWKWLGAYVRKMENKDGGHGTSQYL